jgi:hypothetical protein
MDQNACIFERCCHKGGLVDGNPFLDLLQQTVRCRFESRSDGDATGGGEETAQVRRERLFKSDIAPP